MCTPPSNSDNFVKELKTVFGLSLRGENMKVEKTASTKQKMLNIRKDSSKFLKGLVVRLQCAGWTPTEAEAEANVLTSKLINGWLLGKSAYLGKERKSPPLKNIKEHELNGVWDMAKQEQDFIVKYAH